MVEVRLRAVRVDLQSNTPVLLLQESEGLGRTLPIFIGAPEATAIAFALQGMDTPRPMTHDLIRDLLDALGADVIRVVVTELKTATYFAEIVLRHGEREMPVSSRPSDAVAVAVRTGAPLFVADDLMDSEGIMLAVDEEDEEDDEDEDEGPTPTSWSASSGTSSTPSVRRTSRPERHPGRIARPAVPTAEPASRPDGPSIGRGRRDHGPARSSRLVAAGRAGRTGAGRLLVRLLESARRPPPSTTDLHHHAARRGLDHPTHLDRRRLRRTTPAGTARCATANAQRIGRSGAAGRPAPSRRPSP